MTPLYLRVLGPCAQWSQSLSGGWQEDHEWWGEGTAEKQVAQEGTEVEDEHWLGALDGQQEQAPS